MMVKQFVLMGGSIYYASGGFKDYLDSFDTKKEAEAALKIWFDKRDAEGMGKYSWAHIGDLNTGEYFSQGSACNPMKGF